MNVLIIGLGSIASKHIHALNTVLNDCTIYALRSNRNTSATDGVITIFDLEELECVIDFAIISNPTHLHYEWIEKLIDKGYPLFIEKPVLHSLEGSQLLIDKINQNQITTYIACNLRFHPCIQFIHDKISSGSFSSINEVNIYCGSYLPDWRPGKDFRKMYSANSEMGGGVHLDLFHELDYTTWIFGMPKKYSATVRSVSGLKINAVDYANYSLQYDRFTANILLNYYRKKAKRTIEIVTEEDTITIDLLHNKITNDADELLFTSSDYTIMNTYISQIRYFTECLQTNNKPMNSLEESIQILKICLTK